MFSQFPKTSGRGKVIDVTSLTQCHKGSISTSSVQRILFPQAPSQVAVPSEDVNFPFGKFMEVKRNLGGKDIPPAPTPVSKTGMIPKKL